MNKRIALVLLAVLTFVALPSQARDKSAPTAPGKYKEWGPDIDEIEIAKAFKIAGYDRIVVEPFDTSKVPLPDQKAKWYGTMKMTLAGYTQAFAEALEKELKAKAAVEQANQAPKSAKALIVRGTVLDLDPGTRAGRYFGGFGAGAASTKVTVEIVDAATGAVLARVTRAAGRRERGSRAAAAIST